MKRNLTISLLILALVLAAGGFKSLRSAFARASVHEITHQLFHK